MRRAGARGPAQAEITATVRHGREVIGVHEWARAVEVGDVP